MNTDLLNGDLERTFPTLLRDHIAEWNLRMRATEIQYPLIRVQRGLPHGYASLYTGDELVLFDPDVLERIRNEGGATAIRLVVHHAAARIAIQASIRDGSIGYHTYEELDTAINAVTGWWMRRVPVDEMEPALVATRLSEPEPREHIRAGAAYRSPREAMHYTGIGFEPSNDEQGA